MKTIKYKLSVLVLLANCAAFASVYTGVSVGSWVDGDETVVAAQLGYGFKSDSNLTTSLELEVGYWGEAIDSFGYYFDVEVIPALANVKISFPMANQIEGFAGLGIGTSRFEASAVRVTQAGGVVYTVSDNIFTYQFLAGIKFFTTDNFAFKLEYRYMRFKDVLDIDSYGGGVLGGGLEFYF